MRGHFARWLCVVALGGLGSASAGAAELLTEYRFNGSGTTAPSTGIDTIVGGFFNSAGSATDLHGAASSGVSGLAGDKAFDNSASTGMGSAGSGGSFKHLGDSSAIDGLRSFTISGWFKTQSAALGGSANLVNNLAGTGGFTLYSASTAAGNISLEVILDDTSSGVVYSAGSGSSGSSTTAGVYNTIGAWVHFAVTYDGATGEVNFYKGDLATNDVLVSTRVLPIGTIADNSTNATFGNSAVATTRALDGSLDNLRIFGSKTDSSGVQTLAEIQAYRGYDIANVPEPMGLSLAGLGAIALVRRPIRRRTT